MTWRALRHQTFYFSILGLLFTSLPAQALCQSVTLEQCLTLAQPLAQEIQIAKEAVVLARQDRIRARTALTPNIELTASYGGTVSEMEGASFPPNQMEEKTLSAFAGIGFRYSFYLNGRELIAFRAAGELISKSRADLHVARRDYTLQVAAAFYDAIRRERGVRIATANLDRLKSHREAIHQRIAAGLVTQTEMFRAQAEVAQGRASLTEAQTRLAISRSQLRRLVPLADNFTLVEPSTSAPQAPAPTLASAIEMGVSMRPEVSSSRIAALVSKRQVAITKSLFWPKVTLEGAVGRTRDEIRGTYDASDNDFSRDTDAYNAKITVSLPLVDGGLRRADVIKSLSEKRSAEHRVRLSLKEVQRQVESAWYTRITQGERVEALKKSRNFSREFLTLTTKRFKEGLVQSLDLMDANTRLVEAENNLEDARFALILAAIELRHATGHDPVELSDSANSPLTP